MKVLKIHMNIRNGNLSNYETHVQRLNTKARLKPGRRHWMSCALLPCRKLVTTTRSFSQAAARPTTFHSAAALYQELTGRAARAVPGGELLLNSQTVLTNQKTCLVAISRSGTTTETVKAVEKFKVEKRGDVVVISNYDEVLSRMANVNIVIDKGQEESVAQTRSFASMFVAASAFCAKMAGRDDLLEAMSELPEVGKVDESMSPMQKELAKTCDFDRFYFLGSGIRHGLACEVNLKMKEMTLTHSEPFHFLEFRHGPMSMVNQNAVVVGMLSDANRVHEAKVLVRDENAWGNSISYR
jgi:glucosamine--fructose-6-phosphate aminotransferase (isomerizing)